MAARANEELVVLEKVVLQGVNTFVGGGSGDDFDPERISIFLLIFNILLCAQWSAFLVCSAWLRPFHQLVRVCPRVEKGVEGFATCVPFAGWVWRCANQAAVNLLAWRVMRPIPHILGIPAGEMLPVLAQASLAYNIAWPFLIVPNDRVSSRVCDMMLRWQSGAGLDIVEWFGILGIIFASVSACLRCWGKREAKDAKDEDAKDAKDEALPREGRRSARDAHRECPESVGLMSLAGSQGAHD